MSTATAYGTDTTYRYKSTLSEVSGSCTGKTKTKQVKRTML